MDVRSYADYASRALAVVNPAISVHDRVANAAFGLCGELGEIIDIYKKHQFQGHPLDYDKLINELGDVFWYLNLGLQTVLGPEKAAVEWEQSLDLTVQYAQRDATVEAALFSAINSASTAGELLFNHNWVDMAHIEAAVRFYYCLVNIRTVCRREDLDVNDILTKNLTKLYARYPEGVFSVERSVNRVE